MAKQRLFEPTAVIISIWMILYNFQDKPDEDSKTLLKLSYLVMILVTYFGAVQEGIRFAQCIYLAGFLMSLIWIILEMIFEFGYTFQLTMNVLYSFFLVYYLYFGQQNGWGNLDRYMSSGPYQVGTRLIRTETLGTQVLVYYPIEFDDYNASIEKNNMPYNLHYDINELKKANYVAFQTTWLMTNWFHIETNTVENGLLAPIFQQGFSKLNPIVFSHGYMSNLVQYTCLCRELASYGYIVFSVGHQDGSQYYTTDAEGNSLFYNSVDVFSGDYYEVMGPVQEKLEIRANEIIELRKELAAMTPESNFYKQIFGEETKDAEINMNKFTVSGDSFGGITAIEVAQNLTSTECHACLTMDPWMAPRVNEFDSEESEFFSTFDVDVQVLVTSNFYFDQDSHSTFADQYSLFLGQITSDVKEQCIFRPMDHIQQSDLVYVEPFLSMLIMGKFPPQDLYILHAQKMIRFLNHLDISEEKYVLDNYMKQIDDNIEAAELEGKLENLIDLQQLLKIIII